MIPKEPFLDDDINKYPRFILSAHHFKISSSAESFLEVNTQPPLARSTLRRLSREPYYHSNIGASRSTSSILLSYARPSDIFDYRYFDQLYLEDHEDVLVFDSDSDYGDSDYPDPNHCGTCEIDLFGKTPVRHTATLRFKSKIEHGKKLAHSNEISELGDHLVHMLTFKVNSRAQYTKPPRFWLSPSSDYFDQPQPRADLNFPTTSHHPRVAIPQCESTFVDSFLPPAQEDMSNNMNSSVGSKEKVDMPLAKQMLASDAYVTDHKPSTLRDDFGVATPIFII
ncbi:hypothetical protein METBIDRAFT_130646 [Metschnikowia bicuspidata var. bicuspidata NRRL YB-4993]|uniref:Uncharacterized protein n=1 Tax=Metschnikowia bicuspidata var. bicuspidata NRRL YB-4993 TaxID=869754 RepID=A0A1A0HK93_9ASCO|nr:hypothetical protein METBIDRAFT_130646 [Metschnikowia bicuspidata var. bicuspidata NRRL YB-4993]OBA24307.1 hypothetical protein METBIDRAFT_130646 [Metschnikowia bicuspidata var. bicuspidata NRRL YB-4993]